MISTMKSHVIMATLGIATLHDVLVKLSGYPMEEESKQKLHLLQSKVATLREDMIKLREALSDEELSQWQALESRPSSW